VLDFLDHPAHVADLADIGDGQYVDPGPLYKKIGRFIFELSQLEYTIRHHVGEKAGMNDQVADMVTPFRPSRRAASRSRVSRS
jgi:hypothetical protein